MVWAWRDDDSGYGMDGQKSGVFSGGILVIRLLVYGGSLWTKLWQGEDIQSLNAGRILQNTRSTITKPDTTQLI
ncbi:hypothetical protein BDZ45DRAFT_722019, partial [Acephala macrosclerotiorum]